MGGFENSGRQGPHQENPGQPGVLEGSLLNIRAITMRSDLLPGGISEQISLSAERSDYTAHIIWALKMRQNLTFDKCYIAN